MPVSWPARCVMTVTSIPLWAMSTSWDTSTVLLAATLALHTHPDLWRASLKYQPLSVGLLSPPHGLLPAREAGSVLWSRRACSISPMGGSHFPGLPAPPRLQLPEDLSWNRILGTNCESRKEKARGNSCSLMFQDLTHKQGIRPVSKHFMLFGGPVKLMNAFLEQYF